MRPTLGTLFAQMAGGGDTALDIAVGLVKLLYAKGLISTDEANALLKLCTKYQEQSLELIRELKDEGRIPVDKAKEMTAEVAALTTLVRGEEAPESGRAVALDKPNRTC